MRNRIRFYYNRIREHLWVKPLAITILSIIAAFLARLADQVELLEAVPSVALESLNVLLSITSGSMLGVATFAVGSMLTAYASASSTATPRSFPLVIADDVSQNSLSSFIGAFIFSIVATVALENDYYGQAGRFILFIMLIIVFAIIIFNFIRWIDRIARLGRLGNTSDKVEQVAREALLRRRRQPTMGAKRALGDSQEGTPIYTKTVGYVQRIDLPIMQMIAQRENVEIVVTAIPGTFTYPDQPLVYLKKSENLSSNEMDRYGIEEAFIIAEDRAFDEDPRFGLVVLSEIASRALSPAVNDPGTAIDIIGSFVRIFTLWAQVDEEEIDKDVKFDRVWVPELSLQDMFDDAFLGIARDGAGTVEVGIRLQKAFRGLAALDHQEMGKVSLNQAETALNYAEKALILQEEVRQIEAVHQSILAE